MEEHGKYISAHHDGLQTRNNRAAWGLAILVVILITIIAAFATAFAWKSSHIREMEDMINTIKDDRHAVTPLRGRSWEELLRYEVLSEIDFNLPFKII